MDKNESIRKLDNYIAALNQIEQTKENLHEAKRKVSLTPVVQEKRYMIGRFLWPFLVGATFVLLILCAVGDALFAGKVDPALEMLFIFGLTGVYIIISIVIAKLIQNKKNKVLAEEQINMRNNERERREKIVQRYEAELAKQEAVIDEMEIYLPGVCRNTESARVIRNALKLGRAETIEDAIKVKVEG